MAEKGRVLFSGSGMRMIEDLMEDLSDRYQSEKCAVRNKEFAETLERVRPHVVVLCLQDEQRESMRVYFPLEDHPRYRHIPVIIIGQSVDCKLFQETVLVKNMTMLERPLDVERFLAKLEEQTQVSSQQHWPEDAPPAPAPLATQARDGKRKSVLVVDDDVRMLNVIKLYLQEEYEVTVVPNGKLALKYLEKKHADLVLLDYMMPEMDGYAVLEKIRTTCPEPLVPVLFLTGVADREKVMKTLDLLPNGYLLKPTNKGDLLSRVKSLTEGE